MSDDKVKLWRMRFDQNCSGNCGQRGMRTRWLVCGIGPTC